MNRRESISATMKSVMAGILLVIFSAFYANVTLFTHYHVVDGVTIVHSHFYGKGHAADASAERSGELPNNNSHTKSQYTLISAISVFNAVAQSSLYIDGVEIHDIDRNYSEYVDEIPLIECEGERQLRAPPADISIIG